MSGRKVGSATDRFEPDALYHDLEPLARLKKPPCDFEMERYGKTRKGQGADREGMDFYYPILIIILGRASRSLPMKSILKLTWQELIRNQDIIGARAKQLYTEDEWLQ